MEDLPSKHNELDHSPVIDKAEETIIKEDSEEKDEQDFNYHEEP